jgi:hypothetical protein
VRAQVDHDLTTVSCFDRLLGLIKNLGHHIDCAASASPPCAGRATSASASQVLSVSLPIFLDLNLVVILNREYAGSVSPGGRCTKVRRRPCPPVIVPIFLGFIGPPHATDLASYGGRAPRAVVLWRRCRGLASVWRLRRCLLGYSATRSNFFRPQRRWTELWRPHNMGCDASTCRWV